MSKITHIRLYWVEMCFVLATKAADPKAVIKKTLMLAFGQNEVPWTVFLKGVQHSASSLSRWRRSVVIHHHHDTEITAGTDARCVSSKPFPTESLHLMWLSSSTPTRWQLTWITSWSVIHSRTPEAFGPHVSSKALQIPNPCSPSSRRPGCDCECVSLKLCNDGVCIYGASVTVCPHPLIPVSSWDCLYLL